MTPFDLYVTGSLRWYMRGDSDNLRLSSREISAAFSDASWSDRFPPILTVDQAAELAQVPKQTIYQWRSQGRLVGCCRRLGKHLRFFRDRFIDKLFNEGLTDE